MDFEDIKRLSELPDNELTGKLVALFGIVTRYHDAGGGLSPFDWRNLQISEDGGLMLNDIVAGPLSEEVRLRNYNDYAAIIYCVCTQQKSAESMSWDAGRRIKQPVLREIVLTICGRNDSIDPLLLKLREPYVDEDSFFDDYTTVDEKEAFEAYKKAEEIKAEQDRIRHEEKRACKRPINTQIPPFTPEKSWYEHKWIYFILIFIAILYKGCKSVERQRNNTRIQIERQMSRVPSEPSFYIFDLDNEDGRWPSVRFNADASRWFEATSRE